jgi:inhibitor of cysteine peptidase
MNARALRGVLLVCLLVPALGGIGLAQQASASASASSDGPAQATIGLFPFKQGDALALELTREEPCRCLCDGLTVTGLALLDASEDPIPLPADATAALPLSAEDWVGRIALLAAPGEPLEPGRYSVVVDTSVGQFRAEIDVIATDAAQPSGSLTSRASVCGIALRVYRLVDETSDGSTLTLRNGDSFMVALPGNPTTGYRWMAEQDPAGFLSEIPGPDFHPDSSLVGAGGTFYFRYAAGESGTGTLTFTYARPWESVPPEKTVTLAVQVK